MAETADLYVLDTSAWLTLIEDEAGADIVQDLVNADATTRVLTGILMTQKVLKLTCMVKKEGNQYSSLCLELDVASCGKTKEEAIDGLKGAVETFVNYLVDEGRENEMYRPVPQDAIREFILGGAEQSKLTTVYAVPLEFSYAA